MMASLPINKRPSVSIVGDVSTIGVEESLILGSFLVPLIYVQWIGCNRNGEPAWTIIVSMGISSVMVDNTVVVATTGGDDSLLSLSPSPSSSKIKLGLIKIELFAGSEFRRS